MNASKKFSKMSNIKVDKVYCTFSQIHQFIFGKLFAWHAKELIWHAEEFKYVEQMCSDTVLVKCQLGVFGTFNVCASTLARSAFR